MSMNLFFQAFSPEDAQAMTKNHDLVESWVEDQSRCKFHTDVGTAWDILNTILGGVGIHSSVLLDEVLLNGCELVSAELVKSHAHSLAGWTHDKVLQGLLNLAEDDDAYHLEIFLEQQDQLLEEFDKLVAFYRDAAAQGLAVIHYAA
jgi:hypothetical protein